MASKSVSLPGIVATPTVSAPLPTNVVPLKGHKPRRTHEQYEAAKQFATQMSGYNVNSPIWGKPLPEVLTMIDNHLGDAEINISNGDYADAQFSLDAIRTVTTELRRRVARSSMLRS